MLTPVIRSSFQKPWLVTFAGKKDKKENAPKIDIQQIRANTAEIHKLIKTNLKEYIAVQKQAGIKGYRILHNGIKVIVLADGHEKNVKPVQAFLENLLQDKYGPISFQFRGDCCDKSCLGCMNDALKKSWNA